MNSTPIQDISSTRLRRRPRVVLVVDDDFAMRELLVMILNFQGYTVLAADGASAAIEIAKSWQGEPIDLLITDLVMPGMTGDVLAKELGYRLPALRTIFVSGYSAGEVADRFHPEVNTFLPKPIRFECLARAIRTLFTAQRVAPEVIAPVALSAGAAHFAACA